MLTTAVAKGGEKEFENDKTNLGPSLIKKTLFDNEIEIIPKMNTLMKEFNNPRFSDITLICFGRSFRLHKLLLVQSPFLEPKIIDADVILLDLSEWPQLTQSGLEIALRDLYSLDQSRDFISPDNVFSVLMAGCFLELTSLCETCTFFIKKELANFDNIVSFVKQLDSFRPNPSTCQNQNQRMLEKYYWKLHSACLGALLFASSLCSVDNTLSDEYHNPIVPSYSQKVPMALFIAQLPLKWIESLLCADSLVIPTEFDRYEITKQVFKIRSGRSMADFAIFPNDNSEEEEKTVEISISSPECSKKDEECEIKDKENEGATSKPFSVASQIVNFFTSSTRKKRKLEEFDSSASNDCQSSPASKDERLIKPLRKTPIWPKENSMKLPSSLSNIYERGIVYTFMTFQQLGIVKKDGLVPFHLALESYWKQAELLQGSNVSDMVESPDQQESLPFRFAVKFSNIISYFNKSPRPAMMTSESISCAGIQYRLLLSIEKERDEGSDEIVLKALLQKSKGKGPKLAYSIYMYDQRQPLTHSTLLTCLDPITKCDQEGEGYANEIRLQSKVKQESGKDCIWLTISMKFL